MLDFIKWYAALTVLGAISLPLTRRLFKQLPSGGFYLARALSLLIWTFFFWFFSSIKLLNNDLSSQITILIGMVVLNLWILDREGWADFKQWLLSIRNLIWAAELVFLFAFIAWALVRAANPEIMFTEKYMEMAFINAILRAPGFPPPDPWLSGYAIAYYYFGYVMIAMLIRFTGTLPEIAYNLVASAWFALTALGAYGIATDLFHGKPNHGVFHRGKKWILKFALLAPLLLLIVSNWHAVLDTLHQRGFWRIPELGGAESQVWQTLKMRELDGVANDNSWYIGQRNWPWWAASRTVRDFIPHSPEALEVIDEFPQFTFLLSDLHPHLLVLPFSMLAISMALNAYWSTPSLSDGFRRAIKEQTVELVFAGLVLGAIGFMNTWDMPFYMLLFGMAWVYGYYQDYRSAGFLSNLIKIGLLLGILAITPYLPFYLSFSSGAKGILPSMVFFTHNRYFWTMFGPLLVILIAGFAYASRHYWKKGNLLPGILPVIGLIILLALAMFSLGAMVKLRPQLEQAALHALGYPSLIDLVKDVLATRLKDPGTLITIILLGTLMTITINGHQLRNGTSTHAQKSSSSLIFTAFLGLMGLFLVLLPEFIYLSDPFQTRMNTIFKFYIQAWVFWSLAGAYLLAKLLQPDIPFALEDKIAPLGAGLIAIAAMLLGLPIIPTWFSRFNSGLKGFGSSVLDWLLVCLFAILFLWLLIKLGRGSSSRALGVLGIISLVLGLIYPVNMIWNKTNGFAPLHGFSLDGTLSQRKMNADLFAGIDWMRSAPYGVIAEAARDDYSLYNPYSTFTGYPSVLGWPGHEDQWRGGPALADQREADLLSLYATRDWEKAKEILNKYEVKYLVLGDLERQTYPVVPEKFEQNMKIVFQQGNMQIFQWEGSSAP
jgi:YYY domain-containing protein